MRPWLERDRVAGGDEATSCDRLTPPPPSRRPSPAPSHTSVPNVDRRFPARAVSGSCGGASRTRRRPASYNLLVPDQKPPRLDTDERATLHALLQYQRESLVRKVAGVDDDAARRTSVASGTTLLWLLKHMARAESLWILQRFAGQNDEIPDSTVTPEDTLEAAVDLYQRTWRRVDDVVVITPSLDEVGSGDGDETPVNLRWILMHLLEETARHAGHADILRELIDGQTGR